MFYVRGVELVSTQEILPFLSSVIYITASFVPFGKVKNASETIMSLFS